MLIKNIIAFSFIIITLLPFLYPINWTGNEYNYFGIAKHNVDPTPFSHYYAAYNDQLARFASDYTMGLPVRYFGYDNSWIILRLIGLTGISIALLFLTKAIGIEIFPTIIALILFNKLGQTYFGGEWLFGGIEPKVFSYIFVFFSLGYAIKNNLLAVALCLTIATYLHFLVGGFWGLAIYFYYYLNNKNKRIFYYLFYYTLSIIPIFLLLIYDNQKSPIFSDAELGHSINQIYSNIRAPHHCSPFLDDHIRNDWERGFLLIPLNLLLLLSIYRLKLGKLRIIYFWLIMLHVYLIIAIAIAYFDQNTQYFGKFLLFRPSSFILLLNLLIYCDLIYNFIIKIKISANIMYCTLSIMVFYFTFNRISVNNIAHIPTVFESLNFDEKTVVNWLKSNTKSSDIVLFEENNNGKLSAESIEQLIDRPTLVNWKFVPTTRYSIGRWYHLFLLKRQAFTGVCSAFRLLPAKYYVAHTLSGYDGISSCAPIIFSIGKYYIAYNHLK